MYDVGSIEDWILVGRDGGEASRPAPELGGVLDMLGEDRSSCVVVVAMRRRVRHGDSPKHELNLQQSIIYLWFNKII